MKELYDNKIITSFPGPPNKKNKGIAGLIAEIVTYSVYKTSGL